MLCLSAVTMIALNALVDLSTFGVLTCGMNQINEEVEMIGTTLRTVREARGLALSEVAMKAAVDQGHLSRVERGLSGLSVDSLARVAAAIGLDELERLLRPHIVAGAADRNG